jgi:hypothetical protein
VYRTQSGTGGVIPESEDDERAAADPRDYDVEHYARVLRETYAARLARAFTPEDFAAVFADPDQLSLFDAPVDGIRPILTTFTETTADPAPDSS